MFHSDLRNYQSVFGRSLLHPLTPDVFALLSVFPIVTDIFSKMWKCGAGKRPA